MINTGLSYIWAQMDTEVGKLTPEGFCQMHWPAAGLEGSY